MLTIERILVPIDFSAPSMQALDEAVEFSRPYEAELVVMFAVARTESAVLGPDSDLYERARAAREQLEEICNNVGRRGISCQPRVEFGIAYQAILEAAKNVKADLIVMSTHGRTGLAHILIGSVAEKVLHHASCPILLLRNAR